MPGDYGPAGKWIHDRAHRIMKEGDTKDEYGKKKGKSVAYAIATQQAHKLGKSPKDFRTPSGVHEAKQKYDEPKGEYQKTAMLTAFFDELDAIEKEALAKGLLLAGGIGSAVAGGGAHIGKKIVAAKPTQALTQALSSQRPSVLERFHRTMASGQAAEINRDLAQALRGGK